MTIVYFVSLSQSAVWTIAHRRSAHLDHYSLSVIYYHGSLNQSCAFSLSFKVILPFNASWISFQSRCLGIAQKIARLMTLVMIALWVCRLKVLANGSSPLHSLWYFAKEFVREFLTLNHASLRADCLTSWFFFFPRFWAFGCDMGSSLSEVVGRSISRCPGKAVWLSVIRL